MIALRACWALMFAGVLLAPSSGAAAGRDVSLVEAVKSLDRSSIGELLSQGADVNETGSDGTTALHWAAHNGDSDTVARLLEAGADVSAVNRYGIAPI